MSAPAQPSLADLRREIDRIDTRMHELLMERGRVIETLIAVKRTSELGSAFRPGREAEVMRNLAERHRGILPLDTAESIWRVIISTFTFVQAPYRVHADIGAGDAAMRDTARFHFGFTVPFVTHFGMAAVIEAVAASAGDLGIFRAEAGGGGGAWWRGLEGHDRPKVIARLPFIERPDHPAGTPVFVIAKPLADAAVRDVTLASVRLERWSGGFAAAVGGVGGSIEGNIGDAQGLSLLVSAPGENALGRLAAALAEARIDTRALVEVGSHAARFEAKQNGDRA
jgi:chorismate mutase